MESWDSEQKQMPLMKPPSCTAGTVKFHLLDEKLCELDEEGIILQSGIFKHERNGCCLQRCETVIIAPKLRSIYWTFTRPTSGLIRRNLDSSTLHNEINKLNMLSIKLYTRMRRKLYIFLISFISILTFFFGLGLFLMIISKRKSLGGTPIDDDMKETLKTLGLISLLLSFCGLFIAICISRSCSTKRAIDAKKELIYYVINILNEKYNQNNISWRFVEDWNKTENANICIECIKEGMDVTTNYNETVALEIESYHK